MATEKQIKQLAGRICRELTLPTTSLFDDKWHDTTYMAAAKRLVRELVEEGVVIIKPKEG